MENFRHAFDMESYIYYTQAMQAECLAAAYRLWRREWRGRGKESTAGALVWQVSLYRCLLARVMRGDADLGRSTIVGLVSVGQSVTTISDQSESLSSRSGYLSVIPGRS